MKLIRLIEDFEPVCERMVYVKVAQYKIENSSCFSREQRQVIINNIKKNVPKNFLMVLLYSII